MCWRAHGHARGHVISADSGHGHDFLPVADTGTDFCSRIRICRATIRADFARCHLDV
ncbi:hypothetical protein BAE44_0021811 [Dichanthelium oligosanthes]|uniref:Uncharacterized protein n=1 Tax=Dichanthelium oligosanthes TaxID=888268 RepID=A0A1E5UWE0_9POAL|nr:hypothetical protein BAE44_0021811 [Dichanthelium oligosanthes]